jgi:hypothetical protein
VSFVPLQERITDSLAQSTSFDFLTVVFRLRNSTAADSFLCDLLLGSLLLFLVGNDYKMDFSDLPELPFLMTALKGHHSNANNAIIDICYLLLRELDRFDSWSIRALFDFVITPAAARLGVQQQVHLLVICSELSLKRSMPIQLSSWWLNFCQIFKTLAKPLVSTCWSTHVHLWPPQTTEKKRMSSISSAITRASFPSW